MRSSIDSPPTWSFTTRNSTWRGARINSTRADAPRARLLGNGRYTTLITEAGTGYSALGEHALTRWDGDPVEDGGGFFVYLRDRGTKATWSLARAPTAQVGERYEFLSSPASAEIVHEAAGIEARMRVCVAADDDIEVRRIALGNHTDRARDIEVTVCVEPVLNLALAHAAHPAFSKLFVQTEYVRHQRALLARRRPRELGASPLCLALALADDARAGSGVEIDTDRARFVGRGRSLAAPRALLACEPLAGTVGNVLDPIFALRCTVTLAPGADASLGFLLTAAASREAVLAALGRYRSASALERVFEAARAHAEQRDEALDSEAEHARYLRHVANAPLADATRFQPDTLDDPSQPAPPEALQFDNGWGGFSADGAEYVIRLGPDADGGQHRPPQPWINVIANESFGCLAGEAGAGYTWSANSRLNRLTAWSNDPLVDPHSEALYIRDESAGVFWSPTPGPVAGAGAYETRHGFGYTTYRHTRRELAHEVCVFVPRSDPVKIARIRLTNHGGSRLSLSLFAYQRLVLGELSSESAPHVVTEYDDTVPALLAVNPSNGAFAGRVVFSAALVASGEAEPVRHTADRMSFIGRLGSPARPAALMTAAELDGATGAELDPCAALQVGLELAAGQTVECAFLLGEVEDKKSARELVERYRQPAAIDAALDAVRTFWRDLVAGVQIETPSPAIDLMVNGWLAYQNLSCRLWARSAFQQSGGAFGFRDQLQDAGALVSLRPDITRAQILRNAAQQFVEGDVLHWWHPSPLGQGLRTRFSDDLLWLPYVSAMYVRTTGDAAVLDERVRFITARHLAPGEDEAYLEPEDSGEMADVYEHCCRALERSLTRGPHGLPLMGTGDWNDGMNRVARAGRGESVWLGFFIDRILSDFIPISDAHGDHRRSQRFAAYQSHLREALNDAGWDGAWYRRAYYDDGAPLGSAGESECRIDAIAQAWAAISGAAPPERANQALDALETHLVSESEGLIRLLAPPFDRTPHDPGYIKAYVPGIRENGGQYTHGVLWAVQALAEAGRGERAARLLEMLSPVSHTRTSAEVTRYQLEPYVVAADVYGVNPHVGRGGWSWYTGSAGWMYRVALESVLGLKLVGGDTLTLRACVPQSWPEFRIRYRRPGGQTTYDIHVRNQGATGGGAVAATVDGEPTPVEAGAARVALSDDGATHHVVVTLG